MLEQPIHEPQPPALPNRSEAGFTLVEALIATMVLMVGLAAVINLFVVAGSSNHAANQGTAATTAAIETMERLKSMQFTTLAAGGSVTADNAGFFRDDTVPGVGLIQTRWQIAAIDGQTFFIRVRSESRAPLAGPRTRSEFTTFRSCTAISAGCPDP